MKNSRDLFGCQDVQSEVLRRYPLFSGLVNKKQHRLSAAAQSFVAGWRLMSKSSLITAPAMVSPKMGGIKEMLPRITRRCSQRNVCSERLGQMQSVPQAFEVAGSRSRCSSVE